MTNPVTAAVTRRRQNTLEERRREALEHLGTDSITIKSNRIVRQIRIET